MATSDRDPHGSGEHWGGVWGRTRLAPLCFAASSRGPVRGAGAGREGDWKQARKSHTSRGGGRHVWRSFKIGKQTLASHLRRQTHCLLGSYLMKANKNCPEDTRYWHSLVGPLSLFKYYINTIDNLDI